MVLVEPLGAAIIVIAPGNNKSPTMPLGISIWLAINSLNVSMTQWLPVPALSCCGFSLPSPSSLALIPLIHRMYASRCSLVKYGISAIALWTSTSNAAFPQQSAKNSYNRLSMRVSVPVRIEQTVAQNVIERVLISDACLQSGRQVCLST